MNDVLTYHVDTGRSGLNSGFPFAPVGGTWRRYAQVSLGAPVRAAPLYVSQYQFTSGQHAGETHDLVIVATADNRVYAFDEKFLLSGSSSPLWTQQALGPASPRTGSNIPPPVGICGTPVVDRANAVIYVMAYVHGSSGDNYDIFVLDLNSGDVLDQAQLVDAGAAGRPTFDSTAQDQRGGLNLINGWIFAIFADFLKDDAGTYYGWIVACNQADLSQQRFLPLTTTNTKGGGAWGPGGAAAAADGSVYVNTGNALNPTYGPGNRPQAGDLFEGVVHVSLTGGGAALTVTDFYQPTWAKDLNDVDQDFGGSSPLVLPPIGGKQLVVTTAKDGNVYLLGTTLPGFGGELWTSHDHGGLFSAESKTAPAYFHDAASGDDFVYVAGSGTPGLAAFRIDATNQKLVPAWNAGLEFGDGPGAPFVIEDPASHRALVWVVDGHVQNDDKINRNPVLRAFDAVSGNLVFHSDAVPGNAIGTNCPNFAPIVGAGQSIFVGTLDGFVAYANVPPTLTLALIQSTFGQNEVELGLPGTARFSPAGYVELDGFRPADIGSLASPTPVLVFSVQPDPGLPPAVIAGISSMNLKAVFAGPVQPLDPSLPDAPQGFLFAFEITFDSDAGFLAMRTANVQSATLTLTVSVTIAGLPLSAAGQLELTTGEDPRFVNVNPNNLTQFPTWLSFDLRFFKVAVQPGHTVSQYGGTLSDAASAPGFIAAALPNFNNAIFDGLPQDEDSTKLEFHPHDNDNNLVFNFAVARVRLAGKNAGTAKQVRVFFRLFSAQTTASTFDASTTYKTFSDGVTYGHRIPLMGIENGEYRTIPCFASPRVNLTDHTRSMDAQEDPPNVRDLATNAGVETDYFFGCWLDVNQPLQRFLPGSVPAANPFDGPWTGPLQSIQEAIVAAPHQCLIAEISFDETPIPPGTNSGISDKLAQRNIAWIDGPNPGIAASRLMPHPIQIRPTSALARNPDELLIHWGTTPEGSEAQLYLPSLRADDIVRLANRRYCDHHLSVIDNHTIGLPTGTAALIPLPTDTAVAAGLLTIGLPGGIRKGDAYRITVRQLTDARFGRRSPPPPPPKITARARARGVAAATTGPALAWRRATGAFQLNLVISTREQLLLSEERLLATLRWIELQMPKTRSWYPVLRRYIDQIAGRVRGFGGDPGRIEPSPTGEVGKPHGDGHGGKGHGREEQICFTGKIADLIFDRLGDFEGFTLDTEDGKRSFVSRESEMRRLAEWVWSDRLRVHVWAERDDAHRPLRILVCRPPAPARP